MYAGFDKEIEKPTWLILALILLPLLMVFGINVQIGMLYGDGAFAQCSMALSVAHESHKSCIPVVEAKQMMGFLCVFIPFGLHFAYRKISNLCKN